MWMAGTQQLEPSPLPPRVYHQQEREKKMPGDRSCESATYEHTDQAGIASPSLSKEAWRGGCGPAPAGMRANCQGDGDGRRSLEETNKATFCKGHPRAGDHAPASIRNNEARCPLKTLMQVRGGKGGACRPHPGSLPENTRMQPFPAPPPHAPAAAAHQGLLFHWLAQRVLRWPSGFCWHQQFRATLCFLSCQGNTNQKALCYDKGFEVGVRARCGTVS